MSTPGPDVESDHNVVHPNGQMNVGNGPRHESNERNNNDNQFNRADNHNKAVVHLKDNWKSISVCALFILGLVVFLSTYLSSRTGNNTNPVLNNLVSRLVDIGSCMLKSLGTLYSQRISHPYSYSDIVDIGQFAISHGEPTKTH